MFFRQLKDEYIVGKVHIYSLHSVFQMGHNYLGLQLLNILCHQVKRWYFIGNFDIILPW